MREADRHRLHGQRFGNALEDELLRSTISWARASTTASTKSTLEGLGRSEDSCGCADVLRRVRPSREFVEGHSAGSRSASCNHRCAFCIIPTLRGKMRRTIPRLCGAERFVAQGVREINLVSQDSTAFGRDLADGTDLGGPEGIG